MNRCDISIIIPTYREGPNIPALLRAIRHAMDADSDRYEVVIVDDDSRDGIEDRVREMSGEHAVTLVTRKNERGLASAVVEGFRVSRGSVIVVMDADLSHPPDALPSLIKPVAEGRADFVVGSRYCAGGGITRFTVYRRLNAWISRMLARPLTDVRDPLSGYFAFPRRLLAVGAGLDPLGFKIGLELMVKTAPERILEVPILFGQRSSGQSKLNLKEQINYVRHLARLYRYVLVGRGERPRP
jgi:dolichol-phosphate mannosyltransferase